MKNIRRFIIAVVAVCCCAAFTGCGESAGNSSEKDFSSQTKYEEKDSGSKDKDTDEQEEETAEESDEDEDIDEQEEETTEEPDEDEDTDEQKEEPTVKKTESSFTPQFADESELRKSEWLNSDDKTNAGYSITWDDSPCIGKSIAVDGNEIFGGETLGDCDFKNWSVTYDYDNGDKSLESNATANHIYYSHSDFKKPEDNLNLKPMSSLYYWELMQMDLYNDTSNDKIYDECKINSFELGGYGEVGDEGSVNAIEYYGMTEAVESTVELPYGVTWDMGPYDVYDILGTPYHFNTVNEDNPNGHMWVMDYYTIDKYHTITFTFNPEQGNRLCTVKVYYDHLKDK